ncbi:MAG: hypothetical protein HQ567_05605 [Candidatus Nealsonbacteria bacterium]|nr:hypothetical protein [Candidatus Nealsonbacteria bacterium]
MAETTRKIRHVQTAKAADFDEQLWPINVAIVILAGFVAGWIIGTSDFQTPNLLFNGYFRLFTVALSVGLAFCAVIWLQGRVRHRILLCVVISLLVHLWIIMFAACEYLAVLAEQAKPSQQVTEDYERITVPDYYVRQPDQPQTQQSFEEPIASEVPRPTEPQPVQQPTPEPEIPTEMEPPEEPEIPQRQQPNPAVTRRTELTAPRRADVAAGRQISRQEWKHLPRPNRPNPEEEVQPRSSSTAAVPNAQLAPRRPQKTEVKIDQRQTFDDVSSTRPQPAKVEIARRATGHEAIPDRPTTPRLTRQSDRPAETPRTESATPQPEQITRRQQEIQPSPNRQTTARREADAPRASPQASEATPLPTAPQPTVRIAARQRQPERVPQAAQATRAMPTRRPDIVSTPTDVASPQSNATAAKVPQADPVRTQLPQRMIAPTASSPPKVNQQATAAATQPAPGAVAQTPSRRATTSTQPSSQPRTQRPGRIASTRPAPQSTAARAEPSEVAAATGQPTQATLPSDSPSSEAVTRSTNVSPQASSQPAGRELAPMTDAAQLPATPTRRRMSAMQQQSPGADAAPSRPSSMARANRGAVALPSTITEPSTQPDATPASTGGTPASNLAQVPDSTAVRREGSRPSPSRDASAPGKAEFALGSAPAVSRAGVPRSDGGTRPSASRNATTSNIARNPAPATSIAETGVADVGQIATGATASTAQGPSVPSANVRGSAARRGGTAQPVATQTAAGSGPSAASGSAVAVATEQRARMARRQSIPSALSGGGTPRPARNPGGAATPNAEGDATEVAVAAPSGGKATREPPMPAPVGGPRQRITGLPGGAESQSPAGALVSLTPDGAAVAGAAARRAPTSPERIAGGEGPGIKRSATRITSRAGTDLPAAAIAVDEPTRPGTGGPAASPGSLSSSLAKGPSASVRQAAANVKAGPQTAASATTAEGLGSAMAVALAGRTRASSDQVPSPAIGATVAKMGRSTVIGPAIANPGPTETDATAGAAAGGQAAKTADLPDAIVGGGAAAQGGGEVSATQPAEETGLLAGPGSGEVVTAQLSRSGRDESLVPAASTGARSGPVRKTGALDVTGAGTAAPELAAAGPTTSGTSTATSVAPRTDLAGPQRQVAGLSGDLIDRTSVEDALEAGPAGTTVATARGERRLPQGNESGPPLAAAVGRGPLRNTDLPGLPRGVAETVEEQPIAAAAALPGQTVDLAEGTGPDQPSRQDGGLPVQIAAAPGTGGLGYDPSPEVGLPSRRARPESEIIHTISRRFVIERSGGELAVDGRLSEEPTEAFRQRDPGRRTQAAQARGGSSNTEAAVENGLDFFARHQFPDGHWSLHELPPGLTYDDPALGTMRSDSAATGLALLTYLGAGYTHLDDKHREVVRRGIDWLIDQQKKDGDLFGGKDESKFAWFYSHGIATIALCEAYGMTRDPKLREPARKAVEFIVKTQHPQRGGWRYALDDNGKSTETDTSVTGWMLMALKSAQMADLDVPQETLDGIGRWLDTARFSPKQGQYVYNPYADPDNVDQRHGRESSLAMTGEAMLMRMYMGHRRDDPQLIAGADHLKKNLPEVGTPNRPTRNCYYWYYATQAMFQMQDEYWTVWNDRLREMSLASQVESGPPAGSWHPTRPVRDRWGPAGGRHYVTALHLLMLEVYYRHLPLFQELRGSSG